MSAPNFNLVSEVQQTARRDFPMANVSLLNPDYSNPLLDGEWLELDSDGNLARGASNGNLAVFPVFTERGRTDTQAIGKACVIFLQQFEAETAIVNTTGLSVGDRLMVGDVTIGALTRRGLLKATTGAGVVEVGFVTKLFAGETKVRFQRTPNFMRAAIV
jgi:hypothetical protein